MLNLILHVVAISAATRRLANNGTIVESLVYVMENNKVIADRARAYSSVYLEEQIGLGDAIKSIADQAF